MFVELEACVGSSCQPITEEKRQEAKISACSLTLKSSFFLFSPACFPHPLHHFVFSPEKKKHKGNLFQLSYTCTDVLWPCNSLDFEMFAECKLIMLCSLSPKYIYHQPGRLCFTNTADKAMFSGSLVSVNSSFITCAPFCTRLPTSIVHCPNFIS